MSIPSEFLGKFAYDHHEDFDKYLEDLKNILMSGGSFELTKISEGRYSFEGRSLGKSIKYEFVLDVIVESKGFDDKVAQCAMHFKDGALSERRVTKDKKGLDEVVLSTFTVRGDMVCQKIETKGTGCKRFFKREK